MRWRDLFRYRTVWGMMLGFFCLNYVVYFFITWFPSYLVDERGFDLLKLGFFGTVPGLVAIAGSLLGGFTADRLLRKGWSTTKVRKTCLVSGTLCSSVIALAVVVPTAAGALALLSLSYASLTFATASVASLPADVAPTARHVASSPASRTSPRTWRALSARSSPATCWRRPAAPTSCRCSSPVPSRLSAPSPTRS